MASRARRRGPDDPPRGHGGRFSGNNIVVAEAWHPELGLMMPPLGYLTEEDAGFMLARLEAVAGQPLPRYQPPRQGRRIETW